MEKTELRTCPYCYNDMVFDLERIQPEWSHVSDNSPAWYYCEYGYMGNPIINEEENLGFDFMEELEKL